MENQTERMQVGDEKFVELEFSNFKVTLYGENSPSAIDTIALHAIVRTKFAVMQM